MLSTIRSSADYRMLSRLNTVSRDVLATVLNRSGAANMTCCPECRVDDFCHAVVCKLGDQCARDEKTLDDAALLLPHRPWKS